MSINVADSASTQSQLLSNCIFKVCLVFVKTDVGVLKQMDSLLKLFEVHVGELVHFYTLYFANVRSMTGTLLKNTLVEVRLRLGFVSEITV